MIVARRIVLVAALVMGCGEQADSGAPRGGASTRGRALDEPSVPEPQSRGPQRPLAMSARSTSRLGTSRERCTLEEGARLTAPSGRPQGTRVAVAASGPPEGALVAIDGGGHLELSWADPASPTVRHGAFVRELEDGGLFALEMTAPDDALVVRMAPCVEQAQSAQCLYARGVFLDRRGEGTFVTAPVRVAMPSAPATMRVAATDGRVLFAHSHVGAQPALDTFLVDRTSRTVRVARRALGEGIDLDRGPVEILALAASGPSYAVLWRQGAQEADDSSVHLTTALDEHAVPELQEALVFESMTLFAGAIVMVVAFEFSEPSWLRMGFDGELLGEPRPLPAGEEVPIPFTDRRVARLDGDPPRSLEIRDGAGHATAPSIALPGTPESADLARVDGGFLLATLEGEDVRLAMVRCVPASDDSVDDNASPTR
ncbi:MAG: hypothetical protein OHK0013_23770 [Sandaracinaceae bacterium]